MVLTDRGAVGSSLQDTSLVCPYRLIQNIRVLEGLEGNYPHPRLGSLDS